MDYYYDCEFLEGTQKRRIGKIGLPKMFDTKNTIDLISIGIVDQEDREYYAVSKDFNLKEAWYRYDLVKDDSVGARLGILPPYRKVYWIRENVLKPIFEDWCGSSDLNSLYVFNYKNFKNFLSIYGKTNKQIAEKVYNFMNPDLGFHVSGYNNSELKEEGRLHNHFKLHNVTSNGECYYAQPKLHGYYSSYDHVVFCWLFGKMKDLPKSFPMYTYDLKQMFDDKASKFHRNDFFTAFDFEGGDSSDMEDSKKIKHLKMHTAYPMKQNEHHSLSDAKWTKKLHEFLKRL